MNDETNQFNEIDASQNSSTFYGTNSYVQSSNENTYTTSATELQTIDSPIQSSSYEHTNSYSTTAELQRTECHMYSEITQTNSSSTSSRNLRNTDTTSNSTPSRNTQTNSSSTPSRNTQTNSSSSPLRNPQTNSRNTETTSSSSPLRNPQTNSRNTETTSSPLRNTDTAFNSTLSRNTSSIHSPTLHAAISSSIHSPSRTISQIHSLTLQTTATNSSINSSSTMQQTTTTTTTSSSPIQTENLTSNKPFETIPIQSASRHSVANNSSSVHVSQTEDISQMNDPSKTGISDIPGTLSPGKDQNEYICDVLPTQQNTPAKNNSNNNNNNNNNYRDNNNNDNNNNNNNKASSVTKHPIKRRPSTLPHSLSMRIAALDSFYGTNESPFGNVPSECTVSTKTRRGRPLPIPKSFLKHFHVSKTKSNNTNPQDNEKDETMSNNENDEIMQTNKKNDTSAVQKAVEKGLDAKHIKDEWRVPNTRHTIGKSSNDTEDLTKDTLYEYSFRLWPCGSRRFVLLPNISRVSRMKVEKFLNHSAFVILMLVCTTLGLFTRDYQTLRVHPMDDIYVNITLTCVMCMFAIELIFGSIGRRFYVLSFFWWIDLIATISLAIGIQWDHYSSRECQIVDGSNALVNQASRTIRVLRQGGRALRVLRLLRMFQIIRYFRLFHSCLVSKSRSRKKRDRSIPDRASDASQLGQYLAYRASRTVVVIVILITAVLTISSENYTYVNAQATKFKMLSSLASQPTATSEIVTSTLDAMEKTAHHSVLYLQLNSTIYIDQSVQLSNYRCRELTTFYQSDHTVKQIIPYSIDVDAIIYGNRTAVKEEAVANIIFVCCVLVILLISTACFYRDMQQLVVVPLLRTSRILDKISERIRKTIRGVTKRCFETQYVEAAVLDLEDWLNYQDKKHIIAETTPETRGETKIASTSSPKKKSKESHMNSLLGYTQSKPPFSMESKALLNPTTQQDSVNSHDSSPYGSYGRARSVSFGGQALKHPVESMTPTSRLSTFAQRTAQSLRNFWFGENEHDSPTADPNTSIGSVSHRLGPRVRYLLQHNNDLSVGSSIGSCGRRHTMAAGDLRQLFALGGNNSTIEEQNENQTDTIGSQDNCTRQTTTTVQDLHSMSLNDNAHSIQTETDSTRISNTRHLGERM